MSHFSSILGKRPLWIAARLNSTQRVRSFNVVFPLTSASLTHFPESFHQYPDMNHRTMVMVTQTRASVENDSMANDTDSSSALAKQAANVELGNPENQTQSVFVTEACYKRIHHLISLKQRKDLYLRVFVDAGGCSGFTYQFEIDSDENLKPEDDVIFTESPKSSNGREPARVVVDNGSLQLIAGSKIDYVQEMIKSSFEVRENPQSESACGCGSSFALKNFSSNPAVD